MQFLSYLISGISLGSVYALIALGYTMVYGIAKMLNFAHGDIIMIGSYVIFFAFGSFGWNPIVAVLFSMVVCTILGVVIERIAYRPLREAPSLAVLITAIGVSYLLQQVAQLLWTSNTKSFTSVVGLQKVTLFDGQLTISGETIVTILVCIVIMVFLTLFVNHTVPGHAMLAVSEDRGAATADGCQCQCNHLPHFCHRVGSGGCGGCIAVLDLSVSFSDDRCNAWYQGVRCSCFRWDRVHSGRLYRRYPAGNHRKSEQGIYLDSAFRCDCLCSPDRGCCSSSRRACSARKST